MNNQDIHKDFDRSEVRDFLAQELACASRASHDKSVGWIKAEIECLQCMLIVARRRDAVMELMQVCGWTDWAVFHKVSSYSRDDCFPFIGTDKEYGELLHRLEEEKTKE